MKGILYFNTVEDIRLIDMLRISKKKDEHDYSKDYLTFEALEDNCKIYFIGSNYDLVGSNVSNMAISYDNGEHWTTMSFNNTLDLEIRYNYDGPGTFPYGTTMYYYGYGWESNILNTGDKVLLKANAIQYVTTNPESYDPNDCFNGGFIASKKYKASGNILSMFYSDNFRNYNGFPTDSSYNLWCFFNPIWGHNRETSYDFSLYDATNLVLPSTLTLHCCERMFVYCKELQYSPKILPAETLLQFCYSSMFEGCGKLTTAPALPATTLSQYCYSNMFSGCTSLTTAPALPATTLVEGCYNSMFENCTSLNYIKALFLTTPTSSYDGSTYNWVSGVAASGIFVKNSTATWNVTGIYGIPTGWTIETADS